MSYSKDWCKGFCRTCGTGCAQHEEAQYQLRQQLSAAEKERDELKAKLAEMHKKLDERNEATKVWIQSDTQCRHYACQLERELEALKAIGGE